MAGQNGETLDFALYDLIWLEAAETGKIHSRQSGRLGLGWDGNSPPRRAEIWRTLRAKPYFIESFGF